MVKILFSVHTIIEAKQSNRQGGSRAVDLPASSFDLARPGCSVVCEVRQRSAVINYVHAAEPAPFGTFSQFASRRECFRLHIFLPESIVESHRHSKFGQWEQLHNVVRRLRLMIQFDIYACSSTLSWLRVFGKTPPGQLAPNWPQEIVLPDKVLLG